MQNRGKTLNQNDTLNLVRHGSSVRGVAEVFGRGFVLTGIFIKGGY